MDGNRPYPLWSRHCGIEHPGIVCSEARFWVFLWTPTEQGLFELLGQEMEVY